ncbi:MAG: cytochrome c oxidase assembly protein [Alphaproteobacteria bacterium]|nr:cytochrome c oxidase assembly protein [Alphaproteobacteria bacterium]
MTDVLATRNRRTMTICGLVVGAMVGLSFASVPLYRLFCQITGFGGTTQVAERAPDRVLDRMVTVRFNADVERALGWRFEPVERTMRVRIGEQTLAFYRARNISGAPTTGTATFNVTPEKSGLYFNKIECFCFTEQTLAAGEEADFPVSFFVDPALVDDRNARDVTEITLSYSFFLVRDKAAQAPVRVTSASAASPSN